MSGAQQFDGIETRLGYNFQDPELLATALTHRSFVNEAEGRGREHNERLEFLGDAVIDCEVSMMLFELFPDANEGMLTRYRSVLVREVGLRTIAVGLDLGPAMRLGRGEMQTGGSAKPRLLASALEALLGAVCCDGGYSAAAATARRLFAEPIAGLDPDVTDHKSKLQERVQKLGIVPPTYALVCTDGPEHDKTFVMQVEVGGRAVGEGRGRTKAKATQAAARTALELTDEELCEEQL